MTRRYEVTQGRVCRQCQVWKRISEFTCHRKYPDGRRTTCRTCDAAAQRARRAAKAPEPDRRRGSQASGKDWLEAAQTELYPGRRCMELESHEWLSVVKRAQQLMAEGVAA